MVLLGYGINRIVHGTGLGSSVLGVLLAAGGIAVLVVVVLYWSGYCYRRRRARE